MRCSICPSLTAHSGWAFAIDAELAEAGQVVGMDHLDVRDVMAVIVRTVRPAGLLDAVQRLPDRPLADRVDVDLEPLGVQASHDRLELLGVDERLAAVPGRAPVRVEVGLEDGGREVLDHPVLHDLHGRRAEPARSAAFPERDQILHLLDAAVPVPPQRSDDPRGELPRTRERHVGVERRIVRRRRSRPATP